MNFIDNEYDWETLSLEEFLNEGNIPSDWSDFFENQKQDLQSISNQLSNEKKILPCIHHVFRAFYLLPPQKIKVVILGQDPYPNDSAVGLCFSVKQGNTVNQSLKNIYTELKDEGYTPIENGVLIQWVKQGVFLINKALTVEKGNPDSHSHIWYDFTDKVVEYVNNFDNIAWLLMGRNAQEVENLITNKTHRIFKTSHPSPRSATKKSGGNPAFIGSGVFVSINKFLGESEIVW